MPVDAKAEQVAAALSKIATHIGIAKKFYKASGLLRQLLKNEEVKEQQGRQLFEVRLQRLCFSS